MSQYRDFLTYLNINNADYTDYESYMDLLDMLLTDYEYRAEYNLQGDVVFDDELLSTPSTIGIQKVSYDIDFTFRQADEYDGIAFAQGDSNGLKALNTIIGSQHINKRYDGRLCLSLGSGGTGTRLGRVQKMVDEDFYFYDCDNIAIVNNIHFFWNNNGSVDNAPCNLMTYASTSKYETIRGSVVTGTSFNALNPISVTGNGGSATSNNDLQLHSTGFIFNCNFPIFYTDADAQDYVLTGSKDKCINDPGVKEDTDWYIINEIVKVVSGKTLPYLKFGYKWNIGRERICLYKTKLASGSFNLTLKSNASNIKQKLYNFDDEEWDAEYAEVNDFKQKRYLNTDAKPYHCARFKTNIPIFDSEEDADHYLGGKDITPIKRPGSQNPTGSELDNTHLNNASYSNMFTSYYILSLDDMQDVALWLYDPTNIATLCTDSAQLWKNAPIEMIIDSYWTPLEVGTPGTCAPEPCNVCFGQIDTGLTKQRASQLVTAEQLLFNTPIIGSYGDWRDYAFLSFKLYLPYYGMVELPTEVILSHTLKCTYKYYLASKTIKYYLYVDGCQISSYESAVGSSFPISSMDFHDKANERFNALLGGLGASGEIVGGIGKVATGDLGGASNILGGAVSYAENLRTLTNKNIGIQVTGSTAVDGACNDCYTAYLLIEENLHVLPDRLEEIYNAPCYIMDTLGNYNGFIMASDIMLQSSLTEEEVNEIITLINSGIIL